MKNQSINGTAKNYSCFQWGIAHLITLQSSTTSSLKNTESIYHLPRRNKPSRGHTTSPNRLLSIYCWATNLHLLTAWIVWLNHNLKRIKINTKIVNKNLRCKLEWESASLQKKIRKKIKVGKIISKLVPLIVIISD